MHGLRLQPLPENCFREEDFRELERSCLGRYRIGTGTDNGGEDRGDQRPVTAGEERGRSINRPN